MDITLYEEVNLQRLKEVLECDNIPFRTTDDKQWFDFFKKQLKFYAKKKYTDKGFEIRYTQPNKYGRYVAKVGLQSFQKDVRKYISGEYVRDFDFTNCHPVILEQLLKKNNIYCGEFLESYNKNRFEVIEKYNLGDKTTVIKIINNDMKPNKEVFQDLHDKIYNQLVPTLLKNKNVKSFFDRNKKQRVKQKKDYNHFGSFFSHYLQNIENGLLMSFYKFLTDRNIKVHTLCFDGLTVEKTNLIDESFIEEAQKHIFSETGYNITIQEKSTETEWKPTANKKIQMEKQQSLKAGIQFDREHLDSLVEDCFTDEGFLIQAACKDVVKYLNNFMCLFERPFCFGFRFNTNQDFEIKKQIGDIISIITEQCFSWFMKYNCRLQYIKPVFVVNENDPILKENVYNSYQRPKYIECCQDDLEKRCPLFFDFLKRIISNRESDIFNYLLNYMAKIVQVGKSSQCLVMKGKMGVGKSTFGDILKLIVENYKDQYSKNMNDITDLMSRFNALDYQCIITTIEEVVTDAGSYHSIQNKLKDLITAESIKLERKGVDAVMVPSQNNIVILTNNLNPVEVTGDNRRYLILYVPDYEMGNANYFVNVKKEVSENIEYIRGFLYQYQYEDNLNKIRPITQAELNLRELNRSPIEQFVEEEIDKYVTGANNNPDRKFMNLYSSYQLYSNNLQKKPLSSKYFSLYLKEHGFDVERKGKNRYHYVYKKGEACKIKRFTELEADDDSCDVESV